jgi:predicted dehydrogenase
MTRQTRRTFLKSALASAATITIAGTKSSGRVLGANDTIRVGVAGLNGRGSAHVKAFAEMKGVEITYLIDPDTRTFEKRLAQIEKVGGTRPKTVQDIREALDDKSLDAVSVATPNHWHALITIWACQAGKDVYVEKPCSHNVHEGRIAVETARKHNRIVQHGTQSRSSAGWAQAAAAVQSGRFGKLLVSRGLCYKPRESIGRVSGPQQPPSTMDYDLWCGPAPYKLPHRNSKAHGTVHYDWHWVWDYGNGDIGNQGVHEMDKARWMIPQATLPRSVVSLGGRFGYEDDGETPNTQIAVFDYGQTQLVFEVRGLKTGAYQGQKVGNLCHLQEGTIAGNKFIPKGSDHAEPLPQVEGVVPRGPGTGRDEGGHFGNFIAAVRSRKQSDLNADILEGHYSCALIHFANISYRLGEQVSFDPQTKAFGDNKEVYETLARMEEHLKGNGVKLDGKTYRLGRKLSIDPTTESIVGDAEANRMLTRDYRKPFVVPEKVS